MRTATLLLGLAACGTGIDDAAPDAMGVARNGIEGRWHLTELETDLFCETPTSTRITIESGQIVYWDNNNFFFEGSVVEPNHAEIRLVDPEPDGDVLFVTLDDDGYRAGASDIEWRNYEGATVCSVFTAQAEVDRQW